MLGEFLLRDRAGLPGMVENNGAGTAGSLVKRKNVLVHKSLNVDCSLQEGELLLLSLLSTVRKIGIFCENQAVPLILQPAQGVNILHTFFGKALTINRSPLKDRPSQVGQASAAPAQARISRHSRSEMLFGTAAKPDSSCFRS